MPDRSQQRSLERHYLGPHPLVRHYLERMGFRGVVRGCLGGGLLQGLDDAEVLSVLVHNILVSRGPLYAIREWALRIEPSALGLTRAQVERLNDDRIARSLDALASERGRSLFFRLALRIIKDFELACPRVHFDTTTVTFFGQYLLSRAEPQITHGHNKDTRPDLKQLLFGLNVTSDGAVPLLHHVFSGNRTDDSVHVRNLDELRALLGKDDFIYVADGKLCTAGNLAHITSYGGQFVTVLPRTRKEDQLFREQLRKGDPPVRWYKFHQIPNQRHLDGPPDIYYTATAGPQVSEEGHRIIWVRSSQKAEMDCAGRNERIRKAEVELHAIANRVGSRKLKTRKAVRQKVAKVLSHYQVAPFLEAQVVTFTEVEHRYLRRGRPRPGDPMRKIRRLCLKLVVRRNKDALHREARTDGVFPLLTSLKELAKRKVLEIYKYQPYLEKRFALTKSEYGIAPIFLKKPHRAVALVHMYFVAIMLSSLLERQVRTAMKRRDIAELPVLPEGRLSPTPTTPRLLDTFSEVAWHEFREAERVVPFPVKLSDNQKLLLELAEVPSHLYR